MYNHEKKQIIFRILRELVLSEVVLKVLLPILTDCSHSMRKSRIQLQRGALKPSVLSFHISCSGIYV